MAVRMEQQLLLPRLPLQLLLLLPLPAHLGRAWLGERAQEGAWTRRAEAWGSWDCRMVPARDRAVVQHLHSRLASVLSGLLHPRLRCAIEYLFLVYALLLLALLCLMHVSFVDRCSPETVHCWPGKNLQPSSAPVVPSGPRCAGLKHMGGQLGWWCRSRHPCCAGSSQQPH